MGTHVLEELRKSYAEAESQVSALGRAIEARKEEAREVQKELETAALAEDRERCTELMDDLRVIEGRWAELKAQAGKGKVELKELERQIVAYYMAAAEGGDKVDWSPTLVFSKNCIYSGWGNSRSDGQFLAVDKELIQPELEAIRAVIRELKGWNRTYARVSLIPWDQRVRLQVMYPAYQGGCWTDYDGDRLLGILRPLFPRNALGAEVGDFCSGLGVLK